MTTRSAARPLRRHGKARVRTAALPPSYTISGDKTPGADSDLRTKPSSGGFLTYGAQSSA